jgi:hypothetical protein
VYPTFSTDPELNEARVMVRTTEIPSGLKGTVYLNWYDPKDLTADDGVSIVDDPTESWSAENAAAGDAQDNRVSPSFLWGTEMLVFSDDPNYTTTNVRKAIISIPGESFGDNFIVAVHPNPGIQNTYTFAEDNQTLQYESAPDGTKSNLGVRYRTSTLHAAAWNGIKVPSEWKFDESAYSIRTRSPANGIYATSAGPNALSVRLHEWDDVRQQYVSVFKRGATIEFTFEYDSDYVWADTDGDGEYTDNQQLDLFANSGVKLWEAYEIAIYDTGKLPPLNGYSVNDYGIISANEYAPSKPANELLTGVAYGGAYTNINGYVNTDPVPDRYEDVINANIADFPSVGVKSLKIVITENGTVVDDGEERLKYKVETYSGLELIYFDTAVLKGTAGGSGTYLQDVSNTQSIVLLQNHWDSGVRFKTLTITPPSLP